MQIKGVELDFKLTNADDAGRFEHAVDELNRALQKQPADKGLKAIIEYQCGLAKDFVNRIFGDETTYEKLGVAPNDLEENNEIVEMIIDESERQKDSITSRNKRYSPNRAQRRAKKR